MVLVICARCFGFKSEASHFHTFCRNGIGVLTRMTPTRLTPRRMNGITVVFS